MVLTNFPRSFLRIQDITKYVVYMFGINDKETKISSYVYFEQIYCINLVSHFLLTF